MFYYSKQQSDLSSRIDPIVLRNHHIRLIVISYHRTKVTWISLKNKKLIYILIFYTIAEEEFPFKILSRFPFKES